MSNPKRYLKVFLCHASDDKDKIRPLYMYLVRRGVDAWLDAEKLLPGQDWDVEISRAIEESDAIIICLSKRSVDKEGYVQKEIQFALDRASEMPEGRIFLIPARLEDCDIPRSLSKYQWVDLFGEKKEKEKGFEKLLLALNTRAKQVGCAPAQDFGRLFDPINPITQPVPKPPVQPDPPQTPKSFWQKTEVIVAIIGALATLAAALIGLVPALMPVLLPADTPSAVAPPPGQTPAPPLPTPAWASTLTITAAPPSQSPTPLFTVTPSETPAPPLPTPAWASTLTITAAPPSQSPTPLFTVTPSETPTPAPQFTPSPTLALTSTLSPTVTVPPERLISVGYRNLTQLLPAQRFISAVHGVDISPDNRWVASGERNGRVTISTVADLALFKQFDYKRVVNVVAFSPDGRWLAAAGEGGEIMVIDALTWVKPVFLVGHTDTINALRFSPDGSLLVSGGLDGTLRLWDVPAFTARNVINTSRRIYALDVHPLGLQVAVGASDGIVRMWNTDGQPAYELESASGPSQSVIGLHFSPEGDFLATASNDPNHPYVVWDVPARKIRLEFGSGLKAKGVAFSPDGQVLVTYTKDRQLSVWRSYNGSRLVFFNNAHQDEIWAAALSRDGTLIVTCSGDKTVRLWGIP